MDRARRAPERTRRWVQLYAALLHNAHVKGFITGEIYKGSGKILCAPGLNCYSCPAAAGACPLGALQNALASANHRAGWYVLGILLLYGAILGRTVCGWLCPMGLIQELLHWIPTPKVRKGPVTRALTRLKYGLLVVFVAAVPLWAALRRGTPLPAFCKYICPAGTLEGAVGLLSNPANASMFGMLGRLFTQKFLILLAVGLACVFCYRAFCRFLCPLGAIYGLFNRFSLVGVKVDADRCTRCGACVRGCAMDVRRVGDGECIQCGRCMGDCAPGAISIKAGKATLRGPGKGVPDGASDAPKRRGNPGRVAWAAALALLACALIWFNWLDPAVRREAVPAPTPEPAATAEPALTEAPAATDNSEATAEPMATEAPAAASDLPVGHEVGHRLEDFALTCYDGTEFRLADQRGKVTFVNLWATYCAPCVRELPYFDALCRAHPDDVAVIAVHARLVTEDPVAFLADQPSFAFPFATDTDDIVNARVGGTGTLPQTVVLDRGGAVVYNRVGSVTPELLEALYREAN